MKSLRGFTLIELMIVVAIVAILGAIAYPSYQAQVQKSRRADGKEALLNAASLQERWFMQNSQYIVNASGAGMDPIGGGQSTERYYALSSTDQPCGENTCFTLIATVQGAQDGDSNCQRLEINSLGIKSSFDAKTAGNDTTDTCW